ncbi:MAG: aldehyde ferredoxin oxidoreductase family protein [Bacteroidetes bacterium]|nr:aldehyde ferredoxin oxidoreductase family protein [Bacteroidota bacterium]MCL5025562.1 aldehyde ferredoxin oxidoreductase family protein [Chloroflexota bacterium]
MLGGYTGKLLRVDLTKGFITVEEVAEATLRKYIGGSGLGARILYDETRPDTDPLGPDNRFIVMTGPFVGTPVPTSCRHQIIARSPLTGVYGESDCGGTFGVELKAAGFDGIVVSGAAAEPVYLWIKDGQAELRPAGRLWGKDTYATDSLIKAETDPKAQAIYIGQAGENLVLLAGVMNDGKDGRAAGRGGLGAVMGSKKLKAIAARGTGRIPVVHPEKLRSIIRAQAPVIMDNTVAFQKFGTDGSLATFNEIGDLPIKNWSEGLWTEGAEKITGATMTNTILTKQYHCHGCIIGCGRTVMISRGLSAGIEIAGPEYETCGAFGSNCMIDDLEAISDANDLCNRYGLDTISTGSTIAFAMEAYEKGLLTKESTGGIELTWGNAEAMLEMVRQMGERRGLGELLGQGVRQASEKIGGQDFAVHVKGMELPMHDPRCFSSVAVGYATANRGACHLQGLSHIFEARVPFADYGFEGTLPRHDIEGKGAMVARAQNWMSMMDSLKICKFAAIGKTTMHQMAEMLSYITGWDFTFEEFEQAGERIYNLKRMYNMRLGLSRADDVLPRRILKEPRPAGGSEGFLPPLQGMLDEYYAARGWGRNGVPTAEKLAQLGLEAMPLPQP